MPKVYLNEQDRLNNRLVKWVRGQGVSQATIARERGITQQAISLKLKSKSFDFEDICCFVRMFEPETEELLWLFGLEKRGLRGE